MTLFEFQFEVQATDFGGIHARNSSNKARVSISVKHNKNAPTFERLPYKKTIPQTEEEGSTIFTIRTSDRDDSVSCGMQLIRKYLNLG